MYHNTTTLNIGVGMIASTGLLASITNIFLIYVLYNNKRHWGSFSYQIIGFTSLIDGAAGLSIAVMGLIRGILGMTEVFETSWYCSIFGMLTYYLTGISGIFLTTLSFERFLLICFGTHLSPRVTWIVLLLVSIIYLVPAVGAMFTNSFIPDPSYIYCISGYNIWAKWLNRVTDVVFLVPLLSLTVFYISIFIKCLKLSPGHHFFVSEKLALRALLFLGFYHVCFLPNFISASWTIVASQKSRPEFFYIFSAGGLAISMVINPILALFLHRHIREQAYAIITNRLYKSHSRPHTLK